MYFQSCWGVPGLESSDALSPCGRSSGPCYAGSKSAARILLCRLSLPLDFLKCIPLKGILGEFYEFHPAFLEFFRRSLFWILYGRNQNSRGCRLF